MEPTGGLASLAERLREKTELERIQTEKIFTEQLQTLSNNLQASSQNALRTMSDAIAQEITNAAENLNRHYKILSLAFAGKWVSMTVLGIFLCLGLMISGWLTGKFWEWSYQNELMQLKLACQRQRKEEEILSQAVDTLSKTFEALMDNTSGVAVLERNGNLFVTAPAGSESGHTINGRPAIKLKE